MTNAHLFAPTENFGQSFSGFDTAYDTRVAADYASDLARQLTKHGIPVPEMRLFPEEAKVGNGKYLSPQEAPEYANGYVIGQSFSEAEQSLLGQFSSDDARSQQIMTALHETIHHICRVLGLRQQAYTAQFKHPDHSESYGGWRAIISLKSDSNIEERLCDGGSLVYMLSNGDKDIGNLITSWMNRRVTNVSLQHNTARTNEQIVMAHQRNPKRGLDIVESTLLTLPVIEQHDAELDQIKTAHVRSWLVDRMAISDTIKGWYRICDVSQLSQQAQASLQKEWEFRHSPFRNGPLLQKTPAGEVWQNAPKAIL